MQERSACDAIGSAALKACRIHGTAIATDDVVTGATRVIGIVDSKLGVIKYVESLSPELEHAGLPYLEVFQQSHVEVNARRIIQEVPPGIPKGQPPRSHKFRGIANQWTKALSVVHWRLLPFHDVGVGGRNAKAAGNSRVVSQRNARVAGTVDYSERRTCLKERHSRNFPSIDHLIHQRRTS